MKKEVFNNLMEKKMDRNRTIYKLSTIIDLLNHDSVCVSGKPSVRVRYEYDGLKNSQEFTVLNKDITKDSAERIISWLNTNVKSEDIIYGLKYNSLDVSHFNQLEAEI